MVDYKNCIHRFCGKTEMREYEKEKKVLGEGRRDEMQDLWRGRRARTSDRTCRGEEEQEHLIGHAGQERENRGAKEERLEEGEGYYLNTRIAGCFI